MRIRIAIGLASGIAHVAAGQSLARRITGADGRVDVTYPSRASACGDGRSYIEGVFGGHSVYQEDGWRSTRGPCVHGPAHVVATVIDGEVTRLHAYVGPRDSSLDSRRVVTSATEAAEWLEHVLSSARPSLASQALLPLMLADGASPWKSLLEIARSDRPLELRRNVLTWLSSAIASRLSLDGDESSDDAQVRTQAVYSISQRHTPETVPTLIDLARTSRHPDVRKSAIYWVGQTADPRAVDLYAELLGLR
jgi:hypothetical protein